MPSYNTIASVHGDPPGPTSGPTIIAFNPQVLMPSASASAGGGAEMASYARVTASGTVAAGAKAITIANISAAVVATVDGTLLDVGQSVNWAATPGKALDAVVYDPGVGGELVVITVV